MRKIRVVGLVIIGIGVLISFVFFLIGYLKPKAAGIFIETTPGATVFINGEQVGRTPYKATRKPGEIIVKLIPESFERPLVPYETKVNLVPGVETVVGREFGESGETSSGEVISFERGSRDETSLAIVSVPDSAQVVIDGITKAYAPYKTTSISPGEHTISISATGFTEKSLKVKTYTGYKLSAIVNLASTGQSGQPTPTPTPESEGQTKESEIQVLSTPIGFLRVRAEPSTLSEEVGRVTPGKSYPLLAEDEKTGWFKIEYEEGKQGWISNQYSKKVEALTSPTPSASLTPSPKVTPASPSATLAP